MTLCTLKTSNVQGKESGNMDFTIINNKQNYYCGKLIINDNNNVITLKLDIKLPKIKIETEKKLT